MSEKVKRITKQYISRGAKKAMPMPAKERIQPNVLINRLLSLEFTLFSFILNPIPLQKDVSLFISYILQYSYIL
jgi:hypothetical protein